MMEKLTDVEIGWLMAIHRLIGDLQEITENELLKERLNRVFDILPASEPDGLNWQSSEVSSHHPNTEAR
jgi:hypothetical protein